MVIVLEDLSCGYGGNAVVSGVSVNFDKGKLYSLIGRNGCGKSTLLMTVAGLMKPLAGDVKTDGTSIFSMKPKELAKRISFLPQTAAVGDITVRSLVSHGRFPYLPYPRRYSAYDQQKIDEALETAGVSELAGRKISELSGGQRQKARLAMLLAQDTDIMFLDEPTTYLDIGGRLELMELFGGLAESGETIIMALHDLDLALKYSDAVAVINDGKVVMFSPPSVIAESGAIDTAFGVSAQYNEASGQYFFERRNER